MDPSYYPLFLNVEGRPCLVVGGGPIAHQKVKQLVRAGARPVVVSPELSAGLAKLARSKKVRWVRRRFRPGDVAGALLVIAATGDRKVNGLVSRAAQRQKIWVNVVDQPALCTFVAPSVVRRGPVMIGISTGGASPALSKWIRKDLENRYGPWIGGLAREAGKGRAAVMRKLPSYGRRKRMYERAIRAFFRVIEGELKR